MLWLFLFLFVGCSSPQESQRDSGTDSQRPFTIIALGDIGETGKALRGNATYITNMYTGQHDAGKFDAMIFLGDNFYNTGLNVPAADVRGKVKDILDRFKIPLMGLGRQNVHAITGNHDYYRRNALEASILFGLIDIEEGPMGLTDKGNKRERDIDFWTYYYNMPAQAFYPVMPGGQDSVQFLFFDSALPLRTDPSTWRPALDSLYKLLIASKGRTGILWRVLSSHHPFYTVGEHGGYTIWNDEEHKVDYITACDKDSNAIGWLKNWLDPEDLCTTKYQQYLDSIKAVIHSSGVKVQIALAGHEHSLQLLYYPEKDANCPECPKVHIISGAGALPTRVRFPAPPREYTSSQTKPEKEGISLAGFAQLRFEKERVRVEFFDANKGDMIDMGGGRKEFWIDINGNLTDSH